MGAKKIPVQEAREILEHLRVAIALLDSHEQGIIASHVQLAVDMLEATAGDDEEVGGSEHHAG